MSKPEICNHCGQPIKQAYKEKLTKHKLSMLQTAAKHIIETGVNDYDMRALMPGYNNYNNFQKLRYHGLVHWVKDSKGNKVRGHWLITRNGWAFLRGDIELPKYVLVKNNAIQSRAPDTFHVTEVYRGSEVIETTFEYFDDNGRPVGVRPVYPANKDMQQRLI